MMVVSNLFASYRSLLSDLEINPLMVRREDEGVAPVDVRIIRK